MDIGTWKELSIPFDQAAERLPEALASEGFGVVTQMDVQAIFKAKLGIEHPRYRIFGACNPKLAHGALSADPRVGVLLPCNVVLYERADGKAVLGAVDPLGTVGRADSAEIASIAELVGAKLGRVLAAMP